MLVKFPSGQTAHELFHYMGVDHVEEKSDVAQRLISKCFAGKQCDLEIDELQQLINEVENALDIIQDHVGDGGWDALQQHNLGKYLSKLKALNNGS